MSSRVQRPVWPRGAGWLRLALPLGLGAACLWVLSGQVEAGALAGLGDALAGLAPWQWAGALAATAASFTALGQYDVILHRHLRTDIPARQARISGAAAVAIGQTVGMGVVSGALVRWRLLPGLGLVQAVKLATGVAVTFLLGLAASLGLVAFFAPAGTVPAALAPILIMVFFVSALLAFLHPRIHLHTITLRMPSLRAMCAIAALALIDAGFAALAFWCLLPETAALPLAVLLSVYMLALGAAILSGTPGGLGPFELVMVALLPEVPDAQLLGAVVAFRLIYYILPATLAGLLLLRPLGRGLRPGTIRRALHEGDLTGPAQAEAGLCRQSGAEVLALGTLRLPVIRPGQTLCLLFGPLAAPGAAGPRNALQLLHRHAARESLFPLVYKADAALAAIARRAGWRVLHVADDMVLCPAAFGTEGRAFRQLRRKLRRAEEAGVTVRRDTALPWGALGRIDAEWQARQGAARGMTMGRFCPDYLGHQAVFVARQRGRVVGFASFHAGRRDWCLDLMRTGEAAPEGAMHLLVTAAIDAARAAGIARLSLAALPPARGPVAWLAAGFAPASGLAQFKTSFAATRVPRYALARSHLALWLGLSDLWLAIRRPDARADPPAPAPPDRNAVQEDHENYGFARARNV
ncbi:MAG: phosphatidylglycerol lysyltransferase domain-containing protein [Roseovarius sp.]